MADAFDTKWGVDTSSPPDVGVGPTTSYSEPAFDSKWLGSSTQTAAATTPAQAQSAVDKLIGNNGPRYQLWPERLVRSLAPGIAQGLTAPGDVLKSTPENPVTTGEMIQPATALAGIIGTGALPSVAAKAAPLIDPATAELANLARTKYDIPVRGGQISESPSVNYLDSVLKGKPFSGYGPNVAEQHSSFNSAVAKTIGEDADKITPEVMSNAKERLGNNYDTIAANTTLKYDEPLHTKLNTIHDEASSVLAGSESQIVKNQITNVLGKIDEKGELSGDKLQAILRTGSPLDRATKSADTNVKFYAGQVKQSLIDAMGRHAPEDMQSLLKQTNSQYKAMKTIEDLVEKSPTGDISPALLMGAVRKSYSNMAYGGGGELGDLARIGQRFLKEPPQSGTQPRISAANMLGALGVGGGELAALYFHDPVMGAKIAGLAALGAGAKAAANRGVGSVLRSDWYANHLINRSMPNRGPMEGMLQRLTNSSTPYIPPAIGAAPGPLQINVPARPGYYQNAL